MNGRFTIGFGILAACSFVACRSSLKPHTQSGPLDGATVLPSFPPPIEDGAAPAVTLTAPVSDAFVSGDFTVAGTCTDGLVVRIAAPAVAFALDVPCTSGTFTGTATVEHDGALLLSAMQGAGDSEAVASVTVIVDRVGPTFSGAISGASFQPVAHSTPLFTWTAAVDLLSGLALYQHQLTAADAATSASAWIDSTDATSLQLTGLSLIDGESYRLHVRAIDRVGNASTAITSAPFVVDVSPPKAPSLAVTWSLSAPRARLASAAADAADNGLVLECRVDAGAWSVCAETLALPTTLTARGTVSVRARDSAGRLSPVVTKDWAVDLPGIGVNARVRAVLPLADGGLVVGGEFTMAQARPVGEIVRVLPDGTLDKTFRTGDVPSVGAPYRIIEAVGGGYYVAGSNVTSYRGKPVGGIFRLNAAGDVDSTFVTGTGLGNGSQWVRALLALPDGGVIVAGEFTTYNGTPVKNIVRLAANGALDTAFLAAAPAGFNGSPLEVLRQSDGKFIVAGDFTAYGAVSGLGRIVRLLPDGSLDSSFAANTPGNSFDGYVEAVALQADGKLVVGGRFTTFGGVPIAQNIARLEANGTLDTAFNSAAGIGFNSDVLALMIDANDGIVAGGYFSYVDGNGAALVARLESDGSYSPAFTAAGGVGFSVGSCGQIACYVDVLAREASGHLLLGGNFPAFANEPLRSQVRLTGAGASAPLGTGNLGPSGIVKALKVDSLGRWMMAAGGVTDVLGVPAGRLAKFDAKGDVDSAFQAALGSGFDGDVNAVLAQPDGKLVVGGHFTRFNGAVVPPVVRLLPNGTLDAAFVAALPTFTGNGEVYSLARQPDGKLLVGGDFGVGSTSRLIRLATDGSLDAPFSTNLGSGIGTVGFGFCGFGPCLWINTIAIMPSGRIIVGGAFTGIDGVSVGNLAGIAADGTPDAAFNTALGTGFDDTVQRIMASGDGLLVVGSFSSFDGVSGRRGLVRLSSTGTFDTSFATKLGGAPNGSVYSLAKAPDGTFVASGSFTNFGGNPATRVVRFAADGTVDAAYVTAASLGGGEYPLYGQGTAFDAAGRLVVGMNSSLALGERRSYLMALTPAGLVDEMFQGFTK